MSHILVLGSNSFSGAFFVDYCLEQGMRVTAASRSEQPHDVFLPYAGKHQDRFCFRQWDINHHRDEIVKYIEKERISVVVNFAAQSMVAQSWDHPEHWYMTNTVSTIQLHDALRQCSTLDKYVHISTPEVYGTCEGLIQEHSHYNPSTPYATSRAAADMSLMNFHQAYDFPVVFTRAANVFGPHQQLYRIIPRTILFFLTGQRLQLHGGGHSVRSFIHMRDVCDGTLRIALEAEPPRIYHLSTTRNISIRDLVIMIADQLGVNWEEHVDVVGERLGKDGAYLLDSKRAKEELGWQDVISLEQGIDETIAWVRDNLEILKQQPQAYVHKP